MHLTTDSKLIKIDGMPFFVQGMNLFLDPFPLEKNPRKIYTPQIASIDLISKIVPLLKEAHINTVRIWPTIKNGKHLPAIEEEGIFKLEDAGFKLIMNLPNDWHQILPISQIKSFIHLYGESKFDQIIVYCLANEVYYAGICPISYLNLLQKYIKAKSNRLTLVTNANLVYPFYSGADIVGADFFTYKYSISRGGNQDVGAVAKMWLEDTEHDLKYFPKFAYKINDLIMHVYRKKALKENLNYFYFYKNLLKTKRVAEKAKKPLLLTEYGYLDDPNVLNTLYDYLLIKDLCGHVWYNWTNFDPNLDGTIEKSALFDRFKAICIQIEKIKQLEYRNRLSS